MWHGYRFSQRNKVAKKHKGIGVCVGKCVCGVGEGLSKFEKGD